MKLKREDELMTPEVGHITTERGKTQGSFPILHLSHVPLTHLAIVTRNGYVEGKGVLGACYAKVRLFCISPVYLDVHHNEVSASVEQEMLQCCSCCR